MFLPICLSPTKIPFDYNHINCQCLQWRGTSIPHFERSGIFQISVCTSKLVRGRQKHLAILLLLSCLSLCWSKFAGQSSWHSQGARSVRESAADELRSEFSSQRMGQESAPPSRPPLHLYARYPVGCSLTAENHQFSGTTVPCPAVFTYRAFRTSPLGSSTSQSSSLPLSTMIQPSITEWLWHPL